MSTTPFLPKPVHDNLRSKKIKPVPVNHYKIRQYHQDLLKKHSIISGSAEHTPMLSQMTVQELLKRPKKTRLQVTGELAKEQWQTMRTTTLKKCQLPEDHFIGFTAGDLEKWVDSLAVRQTENLSDIKHCFIA